ncbi:MAG: hypothetical protein RLP44_16350 [Aggregatilineales bacterium]
MSLDVATLLAETGLSQSGVVKSTGLNAHLDRLARGEVSEAQLRAYAEHLKVLNHFSGGEIPVDFWDVAVDGASEYAQVAQIATRGDYVSVLARALVRFKAFKEWPTDTAVNATIGLLGIAADYVTVHPVHAVLHINGDTPAQQTIYLWQRLLTGTTRTIRGRETYSHGAWARHNVVELYTYVIGQYVHHEDAWGVSGFKHSLVGDFERNRNQVEHLGISAVVQHVISPGIFSWVFLNIVEIGQLVLLREVNFAQARADIGINLVAWRAFKGFDARNPSATQARLREQLAQKVVPEH